MPSHKQGTIEVNASNRALGASSTNDMQASFPGSPAWVLTADDLKAQYQELCLDGKVNDGGHTFGEFDRDYVDAPAYGSVPTGGAGLPASAHVPNPASPGAGSINPTDQPAPPDGFGSKPNDTPGVGVGSQLSPDVSSAAQSAHTLGEYVSGQAATS